MYVHIGEDTIIHTKEVIAYFDIEGLKESDINRPMLISLFKDMDETERKAIKSVVVTTSGLYLSPFSPATLHRRMQSIMATMSC